MPPASHEPEAAARAYWLETLGCPKNSVDSSKLEGVLRGEGLRPAVTPETADVVVVNTCAFVEEARAESIEVILDLADRRRSGADLVVTGCLAEREGPALAEALPEVDRIAGFGVPLLTGQGSPAEEVAVSLAPTRRSDPRPSPSFDLLELPRPAAGAPWAYVKVAEGCDRTCGFCAIPSFRGRQRSRRAESVLAEVESLVAGGVREVVLVAQDLASYGRDLDDRGRLDAIVPLVRAASDVADRVRLLYLYPSQLGDDLVEAVLGTGVAYFDLSLQHSSAPLLRRMRRWGDGDRFLARIRAIRERAPQAAFRSSFIVGYPGETEADHDHLLAFVEEAQLDWAGFFAFSEEPGTHAATLQGRVAAPLVTERLNELTHVQDTITAARRDSLVGTSTTVLVDRPGIARSHREAPEIDGVVHVPPGLAVGALADVMVTAATGTDLVADLTPAEGAA